MKDQPALAYVQDGAASLFLLFKGIEKTANMQSV
jgi:hypothetical protein